MIQSIFFLCLLLPVLHAQSRTCWHNTNCTGPTKVAFDGPWNANIFAPASRVVWPKNVLNWAGNLTGSYYPLYNVLKGNGSRIIFDFGIEVGGLVTVDYGAQGQATLGMAFSESKSWMGEYSDLSTLPVYPLGKYNNGSNINDGYLFDVSNASLYWNRYTMPESKLRGGFRYLTLFLKDTPSNETSVAIYGVQLEISFMPTWPDLRAYQGFFQCSDETLNKLWYSGAYTLQTNTISPLTGRNPPMMGDRSNGNRSRGVETSRWSSTTRVGYGESILVDGAKRDRAVWSGDLGVAAASMFISIGDFASVRNALYIIYLYQASNGAFPQNGPPFWHKHSDAYHLWTLIVTYDYVLYSGDVPFLASIWNRHARGVEYMLSKASSGFAFNAEVNMLLYRTLTTSAKLAIWIEGAPNVLLSRYYAEKAEALKNKINTKLFSSTSSQYFDRPSRKSLYPQSANALSILHDIAPFSSKYAISSSLTKNWTPYGPQVPEMPGTISPFLSSLELHAHFSIGETFRALDLLRRTWSWYLQHPLGTQSTMIEGFRVDGSFEYRIGPNATYGTDASYISHSHSWSTGPTSALTKYIAGLDVTGPGGKTWVFAPQFGLLTFAEAGFTTKLGAFRSRWILNTIGSVADPIPDGYNVTLSAPNGTSGVLELPLLKGTALIVTANNKTMEDVIEGGKSARLTLPGGSWNITVRSADIAQGIGVPLPQASPNASASSWWPWRVT